MAIPTIQIPDDAWEPNDGLEDPRSRLLTTIRINGCPMHLEAWEVREDDEFGQVPTAVEDNGDFSNLWEAVGADGLFTTVEIGGREYVLVASPYC